MKKLFPLLLALALLLCACDVPSAPSQGGDATEGSTTDAPSTEPPLFPPVTYTPSRRAVPFTPPVQMGNLSQAQPWDGVYVTPAPNPNVTAVAARLVSILPDTYEPVNSQRPISGRTLALMQTIKTLPGHVMPDYFYLVCPDPEREEVLNTEHVYLIHSLYLYAPAEAMLYNASQRQGEIFDLPVFSASYDDRTFVKEKSYRAYTVEEWKRFDCDAEMRRILRGYHNNRVPEPNDLGVLLPPADGADDYAAAYQAVTAEGKGLYLRGCPRGSLYNWDGPGPRMIVRYLNSYPTTEGYVFSFDGKEVDRFGSFFTDDQIASLPDLDEAREKIHADVQNGRITPSHLKNYDALLSVGYDVFGWYTHLNGEAVGVVRVAWHYMDAEAEIHHPPLVYLDDCYLVIRKDGITEISDLALYEQSDSDSYVLVGRGDYSDLGKHHGGMP